MESRWESLLCKDLVKELAENLLEILFGGGRFKLSPNKFSYAETSDRATLALPALPLWVPCRPHSSEFSEGYLTNWFPDGCMFYYAIFLNDKPLHYAENCVIS